LAKEGWKPDVIHAHVSTTSLPAVLIGKLYGIPVIITEHWSGFPKKILKPVQRMIARYVMKRAKVILPVSNFLKEAIEAYGIRGTFRIIPNTINTDIFYPSSLFTQRDDPRKRMLLVTSLLIPQKGFPDLMDALNQLKQKRSDFTLDIVGEEVKPYDYEELARSLGLEDVVRFHKGFRTSEEVGERMRYCDFFVQPSLMETFGVVYIEAMACGKPVIGTDLSVLRDIINEDTGLLVPPGDVEALKKAIEYMLDNYQNYSPEKIAQYVRVRFNYENVGDMLDQVYRESLKGKPVLVT
jgi:glycosyltransferase involved in cell wall biosynthesis